ncbi:YigZ family protein [bacterium]|nr:YigZ family protein [bacterium]
MKRYTVPAAPAGPIEIKEKGSRFISYLTPVSSSEDAEEALKKLRKEHYNSTHVCFAWRLGNGDETAFRYSDDGEPNGTAGLPIYNTVKGSELFNILVASVRYYGGTKLGTGGLLRAYSASAKGVVEVVNRKIVIPKQLCTLTVPFKQISIVTHTIEQTEEGDIVSRNYKVDGVVLGVNIPVESVNDFREKIVEATASQTTVETLD